MMMMNNGFEFPPLADADELEREQEQLKRLAEDEELSKLLIDASMDFPEVQYLLEETTSNIKFLPTCNIHITTGKAKAGKTTSNSIILASVLGHGEKFGFKSLIPNATIVYIDTEQDEADLTRVLRYINNICGLPIKYKNNSLITLHCADVDYNKIMMYAERATEKFNPTLLYIDGIRDCVIDINNIADVTVLMQTLKHIKEKYKCAILCVIHTNKDESDDNPRGHLGTELVNKMCDGFLLKKDGDVFTMRHFASRHRQINDLKFVRNPLNNGLPEPFNGLSGQEKKDDDELQRLANIIVSTLKTLPEKIASGHLKESVSKQSGVRVRELEDKVYWQKITDKINDENFKHEKKGNSTLYWYNHLSNEG